MRRVSLASALFALCVSASIGAQTQPCVSINAATNNVVGAITGRSFAGPGQWAWRYTPTKTEIVRGMRFFTNNNFAASFMSVEVWDQDAVTQLPGKRIAGGTWQVPKSSTPKFQGANFDRAVVMSANTSYWLTWVEVGWSQVPFQGSGTLLQSTRRTTTGWVLGTMQAAKIELYCQPLDSARTTSFGTSCANAAGGTPSTFTNEASSIGNLDFRVEASGFPVGVPAVFILGTNANFRSLPISTAAGCSLNADTAILVPTATGSGNVRASSADGHTALPLPIPNQARLRGTFLAVQAAAFDPQSTKPLQFVFTNAMRITIF